MLDGKGFWHYFHFSTFKIDISSNGRNEHRAKGCVALSEAEIGVPWMMDLLSKPPHFHTVEFVM
jgi:hypothetical protein